MVGDAGLFRIADTANQSAIPLPSMLNGAAERPSPVVHTTATGSGSFTQS